MIYLSVINDRDNIVCYSAFAAFFACVLTLNHCHIFIVIYQYSWGSIGILTWEGKLFVLDQTITIVILSTNLGYSKNHFATVKAAIIRNTFYTNHENNQVGVLTSDSP